MNKYIYSEVMFIIIKKKKIPIFVLEQSFTVKYFLTLKGNIFPKNLIKQVLWLVDAILKIYFLIQRTLISVTFCKQ